MNAFLVLSTDHDNGPLVHKLPVPGNIVKDQYRLSDHAVLALGTEFVTSTEIAGFYGISEKGQRAGFVVKVESYEGWEEQALWEKLRAWQRAS